MVISHPAEQQAYVAWAATNDMCNSLIPDHRNDAHGLSTDSASAYGARHAANTPAMTLPAAMQQQQHTGAAIAGMHNHMPHSAHPLP